MGKRICILLRHGDYRQLTDTPSAHQPFALNEAGIAQARRAVDLLNEMMEEHGWNMHPVVHCSSLLRAWQTAEIIRSNMHETTEIIQTDQLAERSVGGGANLSKAEIARAIEQDPRHPALPPNWKSDSHFRLPFIGAESLMQAGERTATYISQVMRDVPDESAGPMAVLFVGHGAAFRHAACQLRALVLAEVADLSMHHAQPVALQCAAEGAWRRVAGKWKIRRQNESNLD